MSAAISLDLRKPPFRVFAFGAGVQTVALLWAWLFDSRLMKTEAGWEEWEGWFRSDDVPDIVIFADTKCETPETYAAVEEAKWLCKLAGVKFLTVCYGDLSQPGQSKNGTQSLFVPLFTIKMHTDEDGPAGVEGQLLRQCTGRYKIEPMMEHVKQLAGDRQIEVTLGVSLEEAHRMKKMAPDEQIQYRYPLIYQDALGQYTRNDCINYLRNMEMPQAKSACYMCPYKSDARWIELYRNEPNSFAKAVAYDEWCRDQRPGYKCYVHRSRKPLAEVIPLLVAINEQQIGLFPIDLDMSASGGCEEGYCGI